MFHDEGGLQDYRLHELLGSGGFGTVFRATHTPTNTVVALKMLELDNVQADELDNVATEVHTLAQCDSPHVTRYHGAQIVGATLVISGARRDACTGVAY